MPLIVVRRKACIPLIATLHLCPWPPQLADAGNLSLALGGGAAIAALGAALVITDPQKR